MLGGITKELCFIYLGYDYYTGTFLSSTRVQNLALAILSLKQEEPTIDLSPWQECLNEDINAPEIEILLNLNRVTLITDAIFSYTLGYKIQYAIEPNPRVEETALFANGITLCKYLSAQNPICFKEINFDGRVHSDPCILL